MKKIKNISIDRKKGSNNINNDIQLEDIQKRFYKLLLKTTCRKDHLMLCFDKWFDYTYNKKDYIPFLRQHRKISESTKRKSSKKTKDKRRYIDIRMCIRNFMCGCVGGFIVCLTNAVFSFVANIYLNMMAVVLFSLFFYLLVLILIKNELVLFYLTKIIRRNGK